MQPAKTDSAAEPEQPLVDGWIANEIERFGPRFLSLLRLSSYD